MTIEVKSPHKSRLNISVAPALTLRETKTALAGENRDATRCDPRLLKLYPAFIPINPEIQMREVVHVQVTVAPIMISSYFYNL